MEKSRLGEFIEGLIIIHETMKTSTGDNRFEFAAEHEVFYCGDEDFIPEDSEVGKRLKALGWHVDMDSWAYFT